jgi:hypothetical protein
MSAPLRLLLVPGPGQLAEAPWPALLGAARAMGGLAEVAVIASGGDADRADDADDADRTGPDAPGRAGGAGPADAGPADARSADAGLADAGLADAGPSVPPGPRRGPGGGSRVRYVAARLRPPARAPDRHPYFDPLELAYAHAIAAGEALEGLARRGFVPEVAIAEGSSGVALALTAVVTALGLVARLARYPAPAPALADPARPSAQVAAVLAARAHLVVEDFALAHAHAVVVPSDAVAGRLPAMFRPVAQVIADPVDDDSFLPLGDAGPRAPQVTLLGTPEETDRHDAVRLALGRLRRRHRGIAVEVDLLDGTPAERAAHRQRSLACIGVGGPGGQREVGEALAAGAVVVCPPGEGLEHGRTGYVVDLGDADQLEAVLDYAVAYADRLGPVRAAAQAAAREHRSGAAAGRAHLRLALAVRDGRVPSPRM